MQRLYFTFLIILFNALSPTANAEILNSAVAWSPYHGGSSSAAVGSGEFNSMFSACLALRPKSTGVTGAPNTGLCGPAPRNRCTGTYLVCVKITSGSIDCSVTDHGHCDKDDEAGPDDGCPESKAGNPCNVATGNKYQSETDFDVGGFKFIRSYNSRNLANLGLGRGWRHNFQKALRISGDTLIQVSGRGRGEPWTKVNGVWQGNADSKVLISEDATGFLLTKAEGTTEKYDLSGRIIYEADTNNNQTTYAYFADGKLETVTNQYGNTITFAYLDKNVRFVTDPAGLVYQYEYSYDNSLTDVVFPDDTPAIYGDNNTRKTYHYEVASKPHLLTGITDENGTRFATFAYRSDGKAILTEHAQTTNAVPQERIELDYQ